MGAYNRKRPGWHSKRLEWVYSVFPILKERGQTEAGTLSGGESQMCAIREGPHVKPQFLLVDNFR